MLTIACCLVVGFGSGLDLVAGWLVGYAHACILLFVIIVPYPG